MSLITLLVVLLIACVVIWAAREIMAVFGLPPQIQTVVTVLIVLVCVLWLAGQIGALEPIRIGR